MTTTPRISPTLGTREPADNDAVPSWLFLEVPITYAEADALYKISAPRDSYMVARALILRFIYGGEEVRKAMTGEVTR